MERTPAFPTTEHFQLGSPKTTSGMDLRDYFAAAAMSAMVADAHTLRNLGENTLAMHAYQMADAMLAERTRSGKEEE